MTLSDIQREQANATATLNHIDEYIATGGELSPAAVWFLTEEAEGAFNQYYACALAMGVKDFDKTPRECAEEFMKTAINKCKKMEHNCSNLG